MAIGSTLYPNANVSTVGTVSTNNGNRTPVTKVNDGDAVVFIVKNAEGTAYGGNWLATVSIALTSEAALISAPNIGSGTRPYTVNGTTYYFGYQSTNKNWGTGAVGSGATEIYNPLGLPVFNDWFMHSTNANFSQAKAEEIIQTLGIVTDYTPSSSGGSVYIGNNSSSPYKVINMWTNIGNTYKVAKGWVGVGNQPKQFWPPRIDAGNIFSNGEFVGCPTGTSMNNYALSTDTSAYRTNKCLFGKFQSNAQIWSIESGYIRKGATVTNSTSSGWFIPVGRRYGVSKIKVVTKWIATANTSFNLWNFGVAFVDNTNTINVTYKFSGNGSSTRYSDWTEVEYDFSSHNLEYIDYVYVWGCDGSPGFKNIILE